MSANVGSEGSDPNLTPLLDLVLQLIMFFMITVNFVRVEQFDDSITLPETQSGAPIDSSVEELVFLNLDSANKLVGRESTTVLDTPEKIRVHLKEARENSERIWRAKGNPGEPKIIVILRADKNCTYRDIWQVLDSCQRAGFLKWQLRVMKLPG